MVQKYINQVIQGDCMDIMKELPDGSIDCVITDPPYGTTNNKWDNTIEFWDEFKRICKGGFVIFSSQPYTTKLIFSNLKNFKFHWIWNKGLAGNILLAKYQPMKIHEEICVFGKAKYHPIKTKGKLRIRHNIIKNKSESFDLKGRKGVKVDDEYYPKSIIDVNIAGLRSSTIHPTQKPIVLMKYLVKTHTDKGDIILDPFAGSGSTLVAAKQLGRKYIGIEISEDYCKIARERLRQDILL